MDPVTLVYYAVVCAVLARLLPQGLTGRLKLAVGAGVGILAALALPLLRGVIGL